jgi:hypothetical protein
VIPGKYQAALERITAFVSGGPLHGEFFRTDAHTAEEALAFIVVRYFDAVPPTG